MNWRLLRPQLCTHCGWGSNFIGNHFVDIIDFPTALTPFIHQSDSFDLLPHLLSLLLPVFPIQIHYVRWCLFRIDALRFGNKEVTNKMFAVNHAIPVYNFYGTQIKNTPLSFYRFHLFIHFIYYKNWPFQLGYPRTHQLIVYGPNLAFG